MLDDETEFETALFINSGKKLTICSELESFRIPTKKGISEAQIRAKAEEIYRRNPVCFKGKHRNHMLFQITYDACFELGFKPEPRNLGKIFGLKPGDVTKASKINLEESNLKYTSPEELLPQMLSWFKWDPSEKKNQKNAIFKILKTCLEKDPLLREMPPTIVNCGVIGFYSEIKGLDIDKKTIKEKTTYSTVTILNTIKKIRKIYNS